MQPLKQALESQSFTTGLAGPPELSRRRRAKLAYGAFALAVLAGVWLGSGLALLGVAGAALATAPVLVLAGRRSGLQDPVFWDAAAFAFVFLGSVSLPSAWFFPHPVASGLLVLCAALATVAALTPFCLGRLVYVLAFRRGHAEVC